MKPRIIRSRSAKEDLAEIWRFIAKDSDYYAERFIRFVDERLFHLAAHPLIGRPRDELAPGLRSFLIRHLVVFYRPVADGIEIARVLHASRDMFDSAPPA
jgi:toxin ParE1/3/4